MPDALTPIIAELERANTRKDLAAAIFDAVETVWRNGHVNTVLYSSALALNEASHPWALVGIAYGLIPPGWRLLLARDCGDGTGNAVLRPKHSVADVYAMARSGAAAAIASASLRAWQQEAGR